MLCRFYLLHTPAIAAIRARRQQLHVKKRRQTLAKCCAHSGMAFMFPALAQQLARPRPLLLILLPLLAVLAPALAHTYPNYIFPPNTRTSHATSALTLSGDRLSILHPKPRRAISVSNGDLAFGAELLRTCSASGGSSSSSSSSGSSNNNRNTETFRSSRRSLSS